MLHRSLILVCLFLSVVVLGNTGSSQEPPKRATGLKLPEDKVQPGPIHPQSVVWMHHLAGQGDYSSWTKNYPGFFVANDKDEYEKLTKFVNDNSKNKEYKFQKYNKDSLYFFCFAPKNQWLISDLGIRVGFYGLIFQVKAETYFGQAGQEAQPPSQPWLLYAVDKENLEKAKDDFRMNKLRYQVQYIWTMPVSNFKNLGD